MTRPTVLDMDLVVVPREATERELRDIAAAARDFTTMPGLYPRAQAIRKAMLSASPYPTAWDDVRKYVEKLEVEAKCDEEYRDRAEAKRQSDEARIAKLEATIKARENGLRVQVENHKHALLRIAELEKEKHAALTMIAMLEKQLAGKE